MTDEQIATIIWNVEKATRMSSSLGTRIGTAVSALLTPLMLVQEIGVGLGVLIAGLSWGFTYLMWATEKDSARELTERRAGVLWDQIGREEFLTSGSFAPMQGIVNQIAQVYKCDPQGEVFPLSQAVRLSWAWKKQQERLFVIDHHVEQMKNLRATLAEKQQMLHDLGDEETVIEKILARLDGDIGPLERSSETLRASRDRLEALIFAAEAAARRRQLHHEIGQLAAQLPAGEAPMESAMGIEREHLDVERQISREIETFLQLERETDNHLRDL